MRSTKTTGLTRNEFQLIDKYTSSPYRIKKKKNLSTKEVNLKEVKIRKGNNGYEIFLLKFCLIKND